jgi:20S proteasome alpha/beta subunit
MSLVVALRASGAVIMAADSRGTIGDPRGLTAINDSQEKLFSLGYCGIGVAGASEMGNALLNELQKKNLSAAQDVEQVVATVSQESAECFARWFRDIAPDKRPIVLFTIGGYRAGGTAEAMIFMLNSQQNFAPQLFGRNPCMVGVPQYAVYLVHRYYDPGISIEKAKALAEYLIIETASQDPKVGGPVKLAVITPDKGYAALERAEIEAIHRDNEALNKRLREFFLKAG